MNATSAPDAGGATSDRVIIAILLAVMFTSGIDMLLMTPVLPQIAGELDVTIASAGTWVTAYAAATAVRALLFGPVSDRRGRRGVLFVGMAVLAVGTAACGAATSAAMMTAARGLAGGGAGLLLTSTTSYVGDHFEPHERAVAMGFVMSGFFTALIFGVPLGAALASVLGWQMMFFAVSGIAGAVWLAMILLLPNPRFERRAEAASMADAIRTYVQLLGQRRVLGVVLMSAAIGASMTMFSVYTSPWLEARFGLSTAERGLIYAVGGPAAMVGGPLAGHLSNRIGRVAMVLTGSALMATMQVVMPGTEAFGRWLGAAASAGGAVFAKLGDVIWPVGLPAGLVFFCVVFAGSFRSAPFQTLAVEVVQSERRGALSALRNSFNQGGAALGAAVGSVLWTRFDYTVICWASAGVTVIGAALLYTLAGPAEPAQPAA